MRGIPFPFPSYGGAKIKYRNEPVIRLILRGCVNRPFFHICVQEKLLEPFDPVIEQIGTYDPLPNKYNEKLIGLNFQRLEHWIRQDAEITPSVLRLLGLAGYFPLHPTSFRFAWFHRKKMLEKLNELQGIAANLKEEKAAPSSS